MITNDEWEDIKKQFGDWSKLAIDEKNNKLYFDGKPVVTDVRLEGWTLGAAWVAAVSTAITVVLTFLAYKEPIYNSLGFTKKTDTNFYLIDRTCLEEDEAKNQTEPNISTPPPQIKVKKDCRRHMGTPSSSK